MTVAGTLSRQLIIEDIEYMVETREWPPRIAERAHMNMPGLARALQRHHRPDLASIFYPYIREQKRRR